MQIYNYDSLGFYTHQSTLDDSDRDPLNTDEYLIPAGATAQLLPALQAKQASRFNTQSNSWEIVPDLVGTTYYLDDSERVMTERGVDLPAGATLEKPESVVAKELESAKQMTIKQINTERDKRIANGIEINGATFDTDTNAQQNVTGAALLASIAMSQNMPYTVDWVTHSNTVVTLDAQQVIGLGMAIAQHKSANIIEARNAKDAVLNASSIEAAQAALDDYLAQLS